ncbi:TonB-dependent receptor domain-containing protein [Lentisalinibacter sediminis]|uniref:TonB-dependent receptor domain-containing protein n=1 Tax=Lentisalinibacter sediminis TaxID=2992237 RepID=UPI00386E2494
MKKAAIARTPLALAISLILAGHQGSALAQEVGEDGAPQRPAIETPADNEVIDEIVAVGRSLSAAEDLINERMDDSVVVDLLGAEAMSRLGDSTVAAALRRVPGLTLVNDKFIYVRGLGERYSSTSLNGSQIPSPDLTRNVIPLDIFPTSIVESIRVQKAWSPELPADFGGGAVDIRTKTVPDAFTVEFEFGTGTNTEVSGDVLTYPGSSDDDFGTDSGARSLPAELSQQIARFNGDVSVNGIASTLRAENPGLSAAEAFQQADQINRELATLLNRGVGLERKDPHPDIDVRGSIGSNYALGELWNLGFLVGAGYETQWRETRRIARNFQFPEERTDIENETTRNVSITGNLNLGLQFADDHEISGTTLFLRNTDDETAIRNFFNENREKSDGLGFQNVRYEFEERNMVVNQLRGTHRIGDDTRDVLPEGLVGLVGWLPTDAELEWHWSDSRARTDIPNQVDIELQTVTDPETGDVLSSAVALNNRAADYRFTDLDDRVENYGWGLTYPLAFGNSFVDVGFGYEHDQKARTYDQRQFSIGPGSGISDFDILQGGPDDLGSIFSTSNLLDPANDFIFAIQGTNNQSYLAATMTDAFYGKLDWTWNDTWRVAGGLRWEDYKQVAVDWNPLSYSIQNPQVTTDPDQLAEQAFQKDEIFPSMAVTYMGSWWADTFQLRFGFSETSVRPDLREITDASYIDPRTGDLVDGNPGVIPADVTNYDVRGEWFFGGGDNLTVTLFYKDIDNPIEFFESAASDTTTAREIVNAESAEVYGIEFEGLKELGFLGDFMSSFFVQGNVTLQDSELVAGPEADAPTNDVRPLTGASEYVANLSLGYDSPNGQHTASIGYNVFGERLYVAGRNGAPDGYEQPFHSLDFVYSWYPTDTITVKAKVQNLLQEKIEIEREGVVTFEEDPGSTFAISFQYRL